MRKSKLKVRVPENAEVEKKVSFGERLFFGVSALAMTAGIPMAMHDEKPAAAALFAFFGVIAWKLAFQKYRKLD